MNSIRKDAAIATKQKLIDTAFSIISEQGYDALTSNLLVQRAGVAKGTLYHHFSSLDDVVEQMLSQVTDSFINAVPVEDYASLSAYLHDLGEFAIKVANEEQGLLNVFFGFLPKVVSSAHYQTIAKKFVLHACARCSPVINQMYKNKLRDEHVDNAVRMVDMFLIGFVTHQTIFTDSKRYREIWRSFSLMLVNQLENDALHL